MTARAGTSRPGDCPICLLQVPSRELSRRRPARLIEVVSANVRGWTAPDGLCDACADRFTRADSDFQALMRLLPGHPAPILPTPLRLDAHAEFTGRGVTIAFLDAGFYAHPDLTEPEDRIVEYVDLTGSTSSKRALAEPDVSSWHGMMTSVVACGNGKLSGGVYRGLASGAGVVLVKCGTVRRIAHDDIRRGLEWVDQHRQRLGIRIVNVSCGGDYEASYLHDALSQSAERLSRDGVLVCAAVGNLGDRPNHPVMPPASAPSVLAVGGLDDKNRLPFGEFDLYHSSYGPTVDRIQKPEVIAPGIHVPAPILPGTPTAAQAALLEQLARAPASSLADIIRAHPGVDEALDAAAHLDAYLIEQLVHARLRDECVISGAYKHVDGTSFASPIVASVAAQMLEANPSLTVGEIRSILMSTARRLPHVPIERQGAGVVQPRAAVEEALRRRVASDASAPTR